jgi:hypothetical protein
MRDYRDAEDQPIAGGAAGEGGDDTMNLGDEAPPGSPATGENLCRACGGMGLDGHDEACPECGGTGRVIVAVSAGP